MRLGRDERALEGIPLRLMIVAVVSALSILPAAEALQTLKDREFLMRAETQLDDIVNSALRVSIAGAGAVRYIDLDFASSGKVRFESLRFGDSIDGAYAGSVVLILTTGARIIRTVDGYGLIVTSHANDTLEIESERCALRLEGSIQDGRIFVVAEVV